MRIGDLSSVLNTVKGKILIASGLIFILLGLGSMKPLGNSPMSVVFLCVGGILLAAWVPLHFQVSRESSIEEKIFALVACGSLILLTVSIAVFTIVKIDMEVVDGDMADPRRIEGGGGSAV